MWTTRPVAMAAHAAAEHGEEGQEARCRGSKAKAAACLSEVVIWRADFTTHEIGNRRRRQKRRGWLGVFFFNVLLGPIFLSIRLQHCHTKNNYSPLTQYIVVAHTV